MSRENTVTAILPTYNRAAFIATALESLLDQTVPPDRIVVVDDGSSDGTAQAVAGFGTRVDYVRQENAGKVTAIANGLARTDDDLIWVMDDDDIAPPRALEALKQPFLRDPGLALSYGGMIKFTERDGLKAFGAPSAYPVDDPRPFFIKLLEDCFVTGHPCVLVRRKALEVMRPFDISIKASVDYYFHLGVTRFGRTAHVGEVVLWQRQHPGARGPASSRYDEAERNRVWAKHDAYLVGPLIDEMTLGEFVGHATEQLPPQETRRALLQRAVIAGRKKLWPRALDDFEAAMRMMPELPLDARELAILSGMLACRYGIAEVEADPRILARLRSSAGTRQDANLILSQLCRPLLHGLRRSLRERRPELARQSLRTWSRLMSAGATAAALRASMRRNLARRLHSGRSTAKAGSAQ